MIAIPQSVTRRIPLKAFLSSDHVSAATGKTIVIVISKNGGAFANPSVGATNATEIANGWYYVDLSTTDTGTQGPIIIRGTVSGVDDVETYRTVVDAHNAGFDALPSVVAAATGGLPTVDASNAVKVQSGTGANQISLSSGTVTVGTNSDKTGYALSASGVQAIWDALTSALTTIGSIGKLLVTNLDAVVSTRSTYAGGDTSGTTTLLSRLTGTRATNLDNLDAAVSTRSTYAGTDTAGTTTLLGRLTSGRSTNLDNLDVAVSTRSSHTAADVWAVTTRTLSGFGTLVSDVSTAVWGAASRTLSAFGFSVTASSVTDKTGYTLTSAYDPAKTASQAGDAMALTAAYDAAKTALPASSYTAPDNSSITAIKAKTDNLPASPAAVSDIPTATQNADALLKRDWTSVTGEAEFSLLNSERFGRTRWVITGTTLIVYKENGVTEAWRATITPNASQDPVSGSDPS